MIKLTGKELDELKDRFYAGVQINEARSSDQIIHTLSSGRIVKGVVENGVLVVTGVFEYLIG